MLTKTSYVHRKKNYIWIWFANNLFAQLVWVNIIIGRHSRNKQRSACNHILFLLSLNQRSKDKRFGRTPKLPQTESIYSGGSMSRPYHLSKLSVTLRVEQRMPTRTQSHWSTRAPPDQIISPPQTPLTITPSVGPCYWPTYIRVYYLPWNNDQTSGRL